MSNWTLLFESEASFAILEDLSSRSLASVAATCKQLRLTVHNYASTVRIWRSCDISLLVSHTWPGLRTLVLSNGQAKLDHITLLASAQLPALQKLHWHNSPLLPAAVQHLAHMSWQQLTSLNLTATFGSTQASAAEIIEACCYLSSADLPQLMILNVSRNRLSAPAVAELAKGQWPRLQALDLNAALWSPTGCANPGLGIVMELAKAPWTAMQDLNLASNQLSTEDACQLSILPWTQLTRLNISNCFVHGVDWDQLSDMLCWHHIASASWPQSTSLDVSHNLLFALSLAELVKGHWPALKSLSLSHSRHVSELTMPEGCLWTGLTNLSLNDCAQSAHFQHQHAFVRAINQLARALPRLTALDISNNGLLARQMRMLVPMTSLEELVLGGNRLTIMTGVSLAPWRQLKHLDLRNCHGLVPADVVAILQTCGNTLNMLLILCSANGPTGAKPGQDLWPPNTFLELKIRTGSKILQSLSAGHWPATRLKALRSRSAEPGHMTEVEKLFTLDCTTVHKLYLAGLLIGHLHMPEGLPSIFSSVNWPVLRVLDLSYNLLEHMHVLALSQGNWPSLEVIDLHRNLLQQADVQHLVHARWPMLTHVDLSDNMIQRCNNSVEVQRSIKGCLRRKWPSLSVYFVRGGSRGYEWRFFSVNFA